MVTATLPPFAQPGMHIDITVAAMGDARTLQGGILVLTSLRGADGQVYAVAQGPVVTGGFGGGRSGATKVVNHPTVGLAPNGAIVERAAPSVAPRTVVRLQLRQEDFTTASRIVEAVNRKFPPAAARAENPGLISVAIPADYTARPTEFVAFLEDLEVEPDRPARVVINERTGTIVIGKGRADFAGGNSATAISVSRSRPAMRFPSRHRYLLPGPPRWCRRPTPRLRKRWRVT